jgi:cytochrome P450
VARVETEVALAGLLRRFPELALAVPPEEVQYLPDPGTLRLAALPVTW